MKTRSRPFSRASGANSTSSRCSNSSMRKSAISGFIAPVSSREMSSSAVKISSTASSEASMFCTRSASSPAALALDQAGHVKPRRVERLQNVVARRGDEARLRDVGVVGFGLGALELGIEPGQLAGALAHAALQRRIGALQRLRRLHARGDVGEGRDQAAVGHAVGAHFDHQAALGEAFEERLGLGGVFGDALGDELVDAPWRRARRARRCGAGFRRARCRRASVHAADRKFRRTAGSSRPASAPCRTPRCPGARDRARSAEFRGCSGSRHWRRRAASARPWSRPCACAAGATAPAATTPRRSPRRADTRHIAAAGNRPRPAARG